MEEHSFTPTETLYGLDPTILGDLPHRAALMRKRDAIQKVVRDLSVEISAFPRAKNSYEEYAAKQWKLKKHNKALDLVKQQITELKPKKETTWMQRLTNGGMKRVASHKNQQKTMKSTPSESHESHG